MTITTDARNYNNQSLFAINYSIFNNLKKSDRNLNKKRERIGTIIVNSKDEKKFMPLFIGRFLEKYEVKPKLFKAPKPLIPFMFWKKRKPDVYYDEPSMYPSIIAGVARSEPMGFERAFSGTNPNYGNDERYRYNCSACVVVFEARMRGYNVDALPVLDIEDKNSAIIKLSNYTGKAWHDPETKKHPKIIYKISCNQHELYYFLDDRIKPLQRYAFAYNNKSAEDGHIIVMDKDESGNIRIIDPQVPHQRIRCGSAEVIKYIKSYVDLKEYISLRRIDNLYFNPKIVNDIMKKSEASDADLENASKKIPINLPPSQVKILEQNKNFLNISPSMYPELLAGIEAGDSMSFDDALKGANPNFNKNDTYKNNFATSIFAFESRVRGYNVEAMPFEKNSKVKILEENPNKVWYNPETKKSPIFQVHTPKNSDSIINFVGFHVKASQRYMLKYKTKNGKHIVMVYRSKRNRICIFDPNNGNVWTGHTEVRSFIQNNIDAKKDIGLCRIDNMYIKTKIANEFIKKSN